MYAVSMPGRCEHCAGNLGVQIPLRDPGFYSLGWMEPEEGLQDHTLILFLIF